MDFNPLLHASLAVQIHVATVVAAMMGLFISGLGIAGGLVWETPDALTNKRGKLMQTWEYKVLSRTPQHGLGDGGERELNALDKEG